MDYLQDHRVGIAAIDRASLEGDNPYGDIERLRVLIREALHQAGVERRKNQTPLADLIHPGMTVLLKPNWVLDYNMSGQTMDCMVTHPHFILAALQEVVLCKPKRVIIADAPIQGCRFDRLVTTEFRSQLKQMALGYPVDVEVVDLRKMYVQGVTGEALASGPVLNPRQNAKYVMFDLKQESLLEPLCRTRPEFRNTCYDPDVMAAAHQAGRHRYVLCQEAFDADVLLNLPKLKAHGKAGLTDALKNLVGLNGDKDYLPHHRVGGAAWGGDCYPGLAPLKRLAEYYLDKANRNIGKAAYWGYSNIHQRLVKWHNKFGESELEGRWYGNDTCWRMVLDLNRILLYGRADGSLSTEPLRKIYSLTDALVAGEKDGPLYPSPISLGVVTFAGSSAYADLVHSALMRFDWQKIPLLRHSFDDFRYRLSDGTPRECEARFGGRSYSLEDLSSELGLAFQPPRGWIGHVELCPSRGTKHAHSYPS